MMLGMCVWGHLGGPSPESPIRGGGAGLDPPPRSCNGSRAKNVHDVCMSTMCCWDGAMHRSLLSTSNPIPNKMVRIACRVTIWVRVRVRFMVSVRVRVRVRLESRLCLGLPWP